MNEQYKQEIEREFDEKFKTFDSADGLSDVVLYTDDKKTYLGHGAVTRIIKSFLLKTASEAYERGREDVIEQMKKQGATLLA